MAAVIAISDYVAELVSLSGSATVHSVFGSSFNIELNDRLLHVASTDAPLSCFGIAVSPADMGELLRFVSVRDRVILRDGMLRIYSVAGVSELDLSDAVPRSLSVPHALLEAQDGMDIELGRVLGSMGLTARIGLPWPERSREAVTELARFSAVCLAAEGPQLDAAAWDRFDASARGMRRAVSYLIGRGLGLTPSGDDVLMGFGTGLRFLRGGDKGDPAARFFQAVEREMPGKTTAISEAYLAALCDGFANEDYIGLLDALEAHDPDALVRSVSRVLSVGHTSGADSLLGFAAAFCCLM